MLLGLPLDYWEEVYIDMVVGPFGKMLSWHNDSDNKTYLMIKARLVDRESVPHFVVFTDTEAMGDSWTTQVEVLQQELLGAGPPR